MTTFGIIVKIILIIQLFMMISTISLASEVKSYQSNENKGMGKIMRLNIIDKQIISLSDEVIALRKELEQLKLKLAELETQKKNPKNVNNN